MEIRLILLGLVFSAVINAGLAKQIVYTARLVHRFSNEARAHLGDGFLKDGVSGGVGLWPQWRTLDYYRRLLSSDVQRQKLKLNPRFPFLYPVEGSATLHLGNDFGWLHYIWIDIGTPKVSFLVALDAGSDLFWVPCDCVQCAPLSSRYYGSLDKDLNQYNPSGSSSSKPLSCSDALCELGSSCPNPTHQCPYVINYYSADTSTSGILFEDVLHLEPGHSVTSNKSVRAPVIVGCGSKQTGSYLSGVAPDGLLGLGLGEIAVPSLLAKAGYTQNSFSLCFGEDDSGRLFFGDLGIAEQETTPFLPLNDQNLTYVVAVDAFCIENSCLNGSNVDMLVDSGTSFTFLPSQIYEKVVKEFDKQVNDALKSSFQGYPWEYCYKYSSRGLPTSPSLTLKFRTTASGFVVNNPTFVIYGDQGPVGFCLAIQPSEQDIGTIGQNFMIGYKMVFNRRNFSLGWSHSNCRIELTSSDNSSSSSSNSSLPSSSTRQDGGGDGDGHNGNDNNRNAVSPAVAGWTTPSKSSSSPSSSSLTDLCCCLLLSFVGWHCPAHFFVGGGTG